MARITVKGIPHDVEVGPEAPLLSVLREQLGLTGANAVARKGRCTTRLPPSGRPSSRNASWMSWH